MDLTVPFTPEGVAREVADALTSRRPIAPFSDRGPFDRETAYAAAAILSQLRGGRRVGRKIGFTNRRIWPLYGVDGPMWGDVTDRTLGDLSAPISLSPYLEPRLEPEVALCLAASPEPGLDERALAAHVAWFAPAFEIVQSVFAGWRFTLADCIATGALHAGLFVGPTIPADRTWRGLPDLTLRLYRDGDLVATGRGDDVLDGPLSALGHLVEDRAAAGERLAPGEIITTGTLTDAQPLSAGTTWQAIYEGSPLGDITATFVD